MLRFTLIALTVTGLFARSSTAQQAPASSSTTYHSIREALNVLHTTKDDTEKARIYRNFQKIPVTDHDDLMALYNEARSRQDSAPFITSEKNFNDYVSQGQTIAARLRDVTDPAFHEDIATLISKEADDLPSGASIPMIPVGAGIAIGAGAKSAVRLARIHALIDAAAAGKNEKARDALWKMIGTAQDGYFGQLAIRAIGNIGDPADISRFFGMLESNPNLRLSFDGFPPGTVQRIVEEVRKPGISKEARTSIADGVSEAATHEDLPLLVTLLHDSNRVLSTSALVAISNHISYADIEFIRKLLRDPSTEVQMRIMHAIIGHAWDERFVPLLIDALKNGPVPNVAARGLGQHHVKAAIPALEEAVAKDPSPITRGEAKQALWEINQK